MSNLWAEFKRLVPGDPLQIGTVDSHNADGTSSITLLGGGSLRARGQSVSVGQKAFVRAGLVEGAAPNLAVEMIDI